MLTVLQTVNTIIAGNMEDYGVPRSMICLAEEDKYDNLPDFNGLMAVAGTAPTVAATWQSPFSGKPLTDIMAWVRGIPKPPKAVCKAFFAVLDKELYEQRGMVLICKVDDKGEPQTLPWTATRVTGWLVAYNRDNWHDDWEDQVWG